MSRPRRIQIPGLIRHVMSRGNGRMTIFMDDTDYQKFVYVLSDVVDVFDVELWSYCLMPNHYHLILRPTRPNLSEAMRTLNGVYATWWNDRHTRIGHVFQGRFKDQIVQQEDYLLTVCRYVALNPVRAELTDRPENWAWSSYAGTIGRRSCASFVAASALLAQFGEGDLDLLRTRFAAYVVGQEPEICPDERIRSRERILGDKAFKVSVRGHWRSGDEPPSVPGVTAVPERRLAVDPRTLLLSSSAARLP